MRNRNQIERNVHSWGVCYRGTKDALIAAGICKPPFPGDPEDTRKTDRRGVRHGRFTMTDPHGRELRVSAQGNGWFCIYRDGHTELEAVEWARIEKEETARRAAWGIKEQRERDEQRAAEKRAEYENEPDKFRDHNAVVVDALAGSAIDNLTSGVYGWRLCDEDRDRVIGLKSALVAAIQNARVVRDGEPERPRLRVVK